MAHTVFGLTFTPANEVELAETITSQDVPCGGGPRVVATANLDHVVNLSRSAVFRTAYQKAWVVTADGMPVFLYARLRGVSVPRRVTGSDLCRQILAAVRPDRHKLFFIVSSRETADRLAQQMRVLGFAPEAVSFRVPPFGFEKDEPYGRNVAGEIEAHGTTHLFVGLGSPKSELWTDAFRDLFGDCYVLNFGAGLDYCAGTRTRAPKLMQITGLEWAWRLGCEPKRLAARYLINSWRFLWLVGRDLAGHYA